MYACDRSCLERLIPLQPLTTLTYEPGSNSLTLFAEADSHVGSHCCLRASAGTSTIRGEKDRTSARRNHGELISCLMGTRQPRYWGYLLKVTTTAFH